MFCACVPPQVVHGTNRMVQGVEAGCQKRLLLLRDDVPVRPALCPRLSCVHSAPAYPACTPPLPAGALLPVLHTLSCVHSTPPHCRRLAAGAAHPVLRALHPSPQAPCCRCCTPCPACTPPLPAGALLPVLHTLFRVHETSRYGRNSSGDKGPPRALRCSVIVSQPPQQQQQQVRAPNARPGTHAAATAAPLSVDGVHAFMLCLSPHARTGTVSVLAHEGARLSLCVYVCVRG